MAPCSFVDVIRKHIPAIMQLVGARLRDHYFMGMITTKCLNTAVMMAYLLCGVESMATVKQCDTNLVKDRFKTAVTSGIDTRIATMQTLRKALISKPKVRSVRDRDVFYVMLTHSVLPRHDGNSPPSNMNDFANNASPNSNKNEKMFPGHVFVIERSWKANVYDKTVLEPRYSIYQSYIGEYDMGEFVRKNPHLLDMPEAKMKRLLDGLVNLMKAPMWTPANSQLWHELTTVSLETCKKFENYVIGGRILPCFRQLSLSQCTLTFHNLIRDAKASLDSTCPASSPGSAVYGPSNLYNISSKTYQHKPLTCAEMRAELAIISNELAALIARPQFSSRAQNRSGSLPLNAAKRRGSQQ